VTRLRCVSTKPGAELEQAMASRYHLRT
jgi:hypothetical protein